VVSTSIIPFFAAGWIGAIGGVNVSQAVQAGGPELAPQITIYVYNWAGVESRTLMKAKAVASGVFRSAGVSAVLLDSPAPSNNEQPDVVEQAFPRTAFFVHIYSRAMAKRFRLAPTMLGLAPGRPEENDRSTVYVFDHVAGRMAQEQAVARVSKIVSFSADKGQILGHGIAHEIGHALLRQASHSSMGLMRASWDRKDLQNMVSGNLMFTTDEAERIRAEVVRRNAAARESGR
jgi:hypothetical protein